MSTASRRVEDISLVFIRLDVNDKNALFVLLADDGTVNRMGTGSERNKEHTLFIGRTEPPLLPTLLHDVTDEMLQFTGGYNVRRKRGARCTLNIIFRFADGYEDGYKIEYGNKSQGSPREVVQLVTTAVALTEPWYQEQKRMTNYEPTKTPVPWWRFW